MFEQELHGHSLVHLYGQCFLAVFLDPNHFYCCLKKASLAMKKATWSNQNKWFMWKLKGKDFATTVFLVQINVFSVMLKIDFIYTKISGKVYPGKDIVKREYILFTSLFLDQFWWIVIYNNKISVLFILLPQGRLEKIFMILFINYL